MRRLAFLAPLLAALALPASASSAPPAVTVTATPLTGSAPLRVTLTAAGDPATYHWDLGGGSTADGATVSHRYRAGVHTAVVTATTATGETASARVKVTAYAVTLTAPHARPYGTAALFRGRVAPGRAGQRVTILAAGHTVTVVKTRAGGAFRALLSVRKPGPYVARSHGAASAQRTILVRSTIDASISGAGVVGSQLRVDARAEPLSAGPLRVRVWRSGKRTFDRVYHGPAHVKLGTSAASAYLVRVTLVPKHGYSSPDRVLRKSVYVPALGLGSRNSSVLELERRLYALHYALRGVDTYYSDDTRDAIYAFQKIYGLPRTGAVDATVWRLLAQARTPTARYSGDHIEVNKTRQVLFVVRGGRVVLITHVSTGATGNTPIGTWHVYNKTPGWLPDGMFDSSFFLRGFAVHGYPSVPPYPASHGCVRVPVWLAPRLYGLIPYGSEIDVYY